jgi:hypothetical protein
MPKGGARVVSGPPPDPNALRRDRPSDQAGWTTLPREVPEQEPPAWPLIDPTERELVFWEQQWRKPQSVMWRKLGQELEVAFFVRKMCEAEQPRASVELRKSIRQDFDSLGLSVQGMLRNRWKIAAPAEGADAAPTAAERPRRSSARSRLKVVSDGEGA